MMSVADVMTVRVVQAAPDESVRATVKKMLAANVGSIAICDGPRLVGIFTERDVLHLAGDAVDLDVTAVGDVMTADPVTIQAEGDVLAAARIMSERRIRHLPVMEGENLLGVVGIRDVMGALVERLWREGDPEARDTAHELLHRGLKLR
jgi:CBS domain-containing protein